MLVARVRDWLTLNKIFFETIAAGLLSIMAILLSWQSVRESSLQTKIQAAQAMPTFVVRSELIRDPVTNEFSDHRLIVENAGAPVSAFRHQLWSFLVIGYTNKDWYPGTIDIPVTGYLPDIFPTGDIKGTLVTYAGNKNASTFAKLCALNKTVGRREITRMRLIHVVKLSFNDLLGQQHDEYFWIRETLPGVRVNKESADRLLRIAETFGAPLDINRISEEEIRDRVTKHVSSRAVIP